MDENTVTTILVSAATAFSTKAVEGPIQTFNDIWNGAFGYKIKYWAKSKECLAEQNYKKYISSIDEKVSKIKEENLQEPQLSIVGPALEASKYYIEEDKIREMFANLISSSMDSTYNGIVQHSFVEIIKHLSSYDAKLFSSLNLREPYVTLVYVGNDGAHHYNGYVDKLFINSNFLDYNANQISLENLIRLGLIKIEEGAPLREETLYNRYKFLGNLCSELNLKYGHNNCIKKYLEITALGKAFKEVCIKDSL